MWILFFAILTLAITVFLLSRISSNKIRHRAHAETKIENGVCCGIHTICDLEEKKSSIKIEYFDDEELFQYKNKKATTYTDSQIEEFREILYSLQKDEIHEWLFSLELRDIKLPEGLKPEARTLLNES